MAKLTGRCLPNVKNKRRQKEQKREREKMEENANAEVRESRCKDLESEFEKSPPGICIVSKE